VSRPLPAARGPGTAVVLVHGYLGILARSFYWRHCRPLLKELEDRGYPALVPSLSPTKDIVRRSARLRMALSRLQAERLILVGHSMGGLDCRYYTHALDHEERVDAVITLGTPHRGSPIANWALDSWSMRARLARLLDRGALRELTPEVAAAFNEHVPDVEGVRYVSVTASRPPAELPPVLRGFGRILQSAEGLNDGMVSVASQRWGERRIKVRADHFELVGWSLLPADEETERPFPHLDVLRQTLAQVLRAQVLRE
jgi:triacylglycerol lipase